MRRRTYLTGISTGVAGLVGVTIADLRSDGGKPQAEYQDDKQVVYEHDDLKLRISQDTVRLGDTIEFEVTNTGDSEITLGCHNPWAIQKQSDGEWRHVTWTSGKYHNLCATVLSPSSSLEESITLSKFELASQADEVHAELRPGQYRFILLGSSPFLALDFTVLDSE